MGTVTVTIPIHTVSEANRRDHWAVKAARAKAQRAAVGWCLAGKVPALRAGEAAIVTLTRRGGRTLDDDNLRIAFKAVRDAVAKTLGVDDGDVARVGWAYRQEKCAWLDIVVEVETRR